MHCMTPLAALVVLTAGAALSPAQTVCFTKIADAASINPYGVRPALHDGMIAFLGHNEATDVYGVFAAPADGSGPIVTIADQQTIAPNLPDTHLTAFWNPDIHNGQVVFAARYDATGIDGMYLHNGDKLVTLVNKPYADNLQSLGDLGVTWETTGSNPWFKFFGGSPYVIASLGQAMPGGGTFVDVEPQPPSLKNGIVTLAAYISTPGDGNGGVYLYDPQADSFNVIANHTQQMPGREEFFDFFHAADSDGQNVVIVGKSGYLGFGGHQGLYMAPADSASDTPSPLTKIAEIGDPSPDGGTFGSFGDVAIDGDLVIFTAFFGNPVVPDSMGLFGKFAGGPIFHIASPGDEIAGEFPTTIDWHFTGLSGNQIVFRGTVAPPGPGGGTYDYALFSATLDPQGGVDCPDAPPPPPPVPTNDCAEWRDLPKLASDDVVSMRDIEVIADDDIWAAGSGFAAHWDGSSWTQFDLPLVEGSKVSLENIDGSASDHVWAVGNYNGPQGYVKHATFRWDGDSWSHVPGLNASTAGNWLWGVEAVSPTMVWAVGSTGWDSLDYFMMRFDGVSWSESTVPDPGKTYAEFQGVSGTGADDIWAVGYAGGPGPYEAIIFHYDGKVWSEVGDVPQPSSNPTLYDVEAIGPDLAWAVGDRFVTGAGHQPISMKWDGVSWEPMLTPSPGSGWNFLFGVSGTDEDHVYATGYHYYGAVSEPIALHWDGVNDVWVGDDLEMEGYSTTAWAAGALSNGNGLAIGTVGYYGGTPADMFLREFGKPAGPADFDCDGLVSSADLNMVLASFGAVSSVDANADGYCSTYELNMVLADYGKSAE